MGTFGAIGEFVRDEQEPVQWIDEGEARAVQTPRAALRITPLADTIVIAYDTLSSDGETWGQSAAFCIPAPNTMEQGTVRALGPDVDAVRSQDRETLLFDLGVGRGHVRMCSRTSDPDLIALYASLEGESLFSPSATNLMDIVLKVQPHRVLISPLARVEVYTPIPAPDGKSPMGPHTHLLPKLIASKRTHAANAPIPDGLQPVLMLHPRSPWRDAMGVRTEFDQTLDDEFEQLLELYGLPEDRRVRARVETAVLSGVQPDRFDWPQTRRGRAQARIALRRLLQRDGRGGVADWRAMYDREPVDVEGEGDVAVIGHS